MNERYKKSLKIVTLLITTLIIGTASATIYNTLNLSANVGVEGLNLNWNSSGIDSGLTATINGVACTLSGLKGPAGGTRTYNNAIKLTSTEATTFDIEVLDVTEGTGSVNLTSIVVRLYDEGDTLRGTLSVWASGVPGATPVTDLSMTGAVTWRLEWDITWASTAIVGDAVTATLKVTTPSP